jgi:hypothetical protein
MIDRSCYEIGSYIRSLRNPKLMGQVVGFGSLRWYTDNEDASSNDEDMQMVYIVKVREASSSLGPATAVFRADMVEGAFK